MSLVCSNDECGQSLVPKPSDDPYADPSVSSYVCEMCGKSFCTDYKCNWVHNLNRQMSLRAKPKPVCRWCWRNRFKIE